MAKAAKTRQVPKSSKTGRIVTEEYLKKNKSTTFMDTVPVRTKKITFSKKK